MNPSRTEHWDSIYATKTPDQVSWTQAIPTHSLERIEKLHLSKNAKIVDVGGGDSLLVDSLLDLGYTDITVVDISELALKRAQARLGSRAQKVKWVACDIVEFQPDENFDLWHDRAAFHFLNRPEEIQAYMDLVCRKVSGHAIVGTFSVDGPTKCSALQVQQYDENSLSGMFQSHGFRSLECARELHTTPSGGSQEFLFCTFSKS